MDTGAEISLLQARKIRDNICVNAGEGIELRGIGTGNVSTAGTSYADLIIEGKILNHEFQICRGNLSDRYDGILGHDILRKYAFHIIFSADGAAHYKISAHTPSLGMDKSEEPIFLEENVVYKGDKVAKVEIKSQISKKEPRDNNCFMNAIVQALNGIEDIKIWVRDITLSKQICDEITCAVCLLAKILWEMSNQQDNSKIIEYFQ